MKIPKSLKLPSKLKKEVKKGITRNIYNSNISVTHNPLSCSIYSVTNYSGSNTKSYRRLCRFARKEEKRAIQQMYKNMMKETDRQMEFMSGVDWNVPLEPIFL